MSGDWSAILEPGERVIWQGQPDGRFILRWRTPLDPYSGVIALVMACLALIHFGSGKAFLIAYFIVILPFGLIMLGIAIRFLVLLPVRDARTRRATTYLLSNRWARAVRSYPEQAVDRYAISPSTEVTLDEGRGGNSDGNVWFGAVRVMPLTILFWHGSRVRSSPATRPVGFELIPDARAVYDLIQGLQRGAA